MDRWIHIDANDVIVRSEYRYQGQEPEWFRDPVPAGGARLRMASTHEDYDAKTGERISP